MKGVKNDLQVPGLRIRWWWDVLRRWWGRKKVWWESFEYCPYTGVFNGFIWVVDASVRIALTMCMTPHYDMFIACVLRERCRLPIYVKKIGNWNDLYNSVLQFLNVCEYLNVDWASLVAQQVKNHLQCGRRGFDPWVGKIPWRQKRLPSPVFWPGEFHGLYSPCGSEELYTVERLSPAYIGPNHRVRHDWETEHGCTAKPKSESYFEGLWEVWRCNCRNDCYPLEPASTPIEWSSRVFNQGRR